MLQLYSITHCRQSCLRPDKQEVWANYKACMKLAAPCTKVGTCRRTNGSEWASINLGAPCAKARVELNSADTRAAYRQYTRFYFMHLANLLGVS